MNSSTICLCVLSLLSLAPWTVRAAPTTLPGIIDEYRFDDSSGTVAVDSVGGKNASLINFGVGNSQWITGMFGGGLNFTNPSAYTITNAPISSNQFSVSFWSLLNAKANSNSSNMLTPQGDNWIGYDQGHGIGIKSVFDPVQPLQGIWENYVVTVNQTTGAASVYRDGVLRASGTVSLPALNTQWVFGHNQDPGNANGSFNGALDEVQIYNRVLSASDAATLASRPPQPGIAAHLVVPGHSFGFQPVGQYSTASATFFVDPATTDWLAWNRFPDLRAVSNTSPGQLFLGTYTPEVDDYFNLTVTNPLGQKLTVAMDQNGTLGQPMGQQSVIFGTAAAAPDVLRGDNFGTPSFFNEAGAFNSIFTTPGNYRFDFSFQNIGGEANYPDVYLLAHTVPEPGTILSGAIGALLVGFAAIRTRRKK
jgi:hypothetical protein